MHITWQEPPAPNGMIMLYEVNYKRHGDTEVKQRIIGQTRQSRFHPVSLYRDDGQSHRGSLSAQHTTKPPKKCVQMSSFIHIVVLKL